MNQKQDSETPVNRASHATRGTAQKPTACLQHRQAFPCEIKVPSPGTGSQETPDPNTRVTQAFMLPDSKRDLDAKEAGGLEGRKQKEKSGLPRPSYLGSLNGFQIKAKGLPWTHSRRGCFPGNLLVPPNSQVQGAEPGSLPSSPSLVAWFTFSAQANPGSPLWGPAGAIHLQGPLPKRRQGPGLGSSKQGMNRTAINHLASPNLPCGSGV